MVFVTGDTHAEFNRFSTRSFKEQKDLTRDDYVIILGDFGGVWHDSFEERYWLDWLNDKSFTTCFIDGNHENFDRLNSEFEEVDFHGGRAHKIRDNIYHLMRGQVFEFDGKTFFTFGGARSHDISDGILNPEDFDSRRSLVMEYNKRTKEGGYLRINHFSWWKEEMPTLEEMELGYENLEAVNNEVDFVLTHCCPQKIATEFSYGKYERDILTTYFDDISNKVKFGEWLFGHYHNNDVFNYNDKEKYTMLYKQIMRVV